MKENTLGGAIIHYFNGEKEEIVFLRDDATPEGQSEAVERLQNAMQSNLIVLKTTANRLLVIPVNNILKIEINPAPPKLPEYALDYVRIVSSEKNGKTKR